jgi:hypothetical protein
LSENVKIISNRQEQSKNDKKATLDRLRSKRRRLKTVEVQIDGETMEMSFAALSAHDMDRLQSKHVPTVEQKARGMAFNPDTFAPALVAACSVDPRLSFEDAKEIWESEAWSSGELNFLFDTVSNLCMEGLDIPFSVSD